MGKYFGTDGFRGKANVKLTVNHAFKVGRYVGWYYGRNHKAKSVIGKDTRRSSYMFDEGTDVAGDLLHENPAITPDKCEHNQATDCQWVALSCDRHSPATNGSVV